MVGSMELFYTQAPDAMRSTCAAIQLLATGIGMYLAAGIVAVVHAASTAGGSPGWLADNINEGHMNYYFWTLAGLMTAVVPFFLWYARGYEYKADGSAPAAAINAEALALADCARGGLAYSPDLVREVSRELRAGAPSRGASRARAGAPGAYAEARAATLRRRASSGAAGAPADAA
jgi:hypothetical protein